MKLPLHTTLRIIYTHDLFVIKSPAMVFRTAGDEFVWKFAPSGAFYFQQPTLGGGYWSRLDLARGSGTSIIIQPNEWRSTLILGGKQFAFPPGSITTRIIETAEREGSAGTFES